MNSEMPVSAKLIVHRGECRIAVSFKHDPELNSKIKQLPGCKWSQSIKSWHLPDTPQYRKQFYIANDGNQPLPVSYSTKGNKVTPDKTKVAALICNENKQALEMFIQRLQLKGYSASTIKTYRNEFIDSTS